MNIEHINKYENADMYLSHDKNQNIKILNSEVTTEEVQKAAKDLKYGQTSGPDSILKHTDFQNSDGFLSSDSKFCSINYF
jgi:hypothetical protein